MTVWKCVSCGEELPGNRRSDKRYCGGRCRVRAHRIRKGEGEHVRPTKKHGHTALKVALGAAAAATAAAAAIELVRQSQDTRLAEQQRKIAELQAQLRKSQTEKEALRRGQEDLRNKVEQVTREKKEKEAQLDQTRKELDAEKEKVKTLRSSLESARLERNLAEQRRLDEIQAYKEELDVQLERAEAYRRLLVESHQQIDELLEHTDDLARQLAVAKDKREVQLAKQSASQGRLLLQSKLENAQAEIKTLKHRLRSVEGELSSTARKLSARAQQKQLPAVSDKTESIRLKGELAQAKTEICLLRGQVAAHKALPASSAQTSLAVANRSIEQLNSENRRLRRQSQLQEQTESEKPGFFQRALTTIGMIGTGVVLGAGTVAMLGREDSAKALGPAPERKALGPKTQRQLPPKSNS